MPAEPALKKLAEEIGVEGHGLEDLAHKPKIQAAVLRQIQGVGKTAKLAGIEMIDAVILADEEWTPQNVSFGLNELDNFIGSELLTAGC